MSHVPKEGSDKSVTALLFDFFNLFPSYKSININAARAKGGCKDVIGESVLKLLGNLYGKKKLWILWVFCDNHCCAL